MTQDILTDIHETLINTIETVMSKKANEGKAYIIVEYGRNMRNKKMFIRKIYLTKTK